VPASSERGSARTLHHREAPRYRRVATALAERLRQLRAARGWTVEVSAERIGVEPAYVRRLEAGTANASLAVLVSVAQAYGMLVHELLTPRAAVRGAAKADDT